MKTGLFAWTMGFLLGVAGCGGETTGSGAAGTAGAGGSATTASGGAGTGGSGTAGTGGSSSGPPLAPTLDSASPLEGALHVTWTNNTPDCDKIELDRNKDGGAYALAYTLTGQATSQHDTQAAAPGMYCYKARCIKGMETSPDSNEKCGTP